MTTPTDLPGRQGFTGHIAVPVPVRVLVDRAGDVWVPTGVVTAEGERVWSCPNPVDLSERGGEGPSYEWTERTIRLVFGPLAIGGAA